VKVATAMPVQFSRIKYISSEEASNNQTLLTTSLSLVLLKARGLCCSAKRVCRLSGNLQLWHQSTTSTCFSGEASTSSRTKYSTMRSSSTQENGPVSTSQMRLLSEFAWLWLSHSEGYLLLVGRALESTRQCCWTTFMK
jgi:hypothetical protein